MHGTYVFQRKTIEYRSFTSGKNSQSVIRVAVWVNERSYVATHTTKYESPHCVDGRQLIR